MLANEVLSFIEENDVKFIRLAFTDLFGRLRNIAVLPDQLAPAMESGRARLRTAARHAKEAGLEVRIGTDCEFYLLNLDDHGRPTLDPYDRGGYMDVAPMDRCEDIRRDIVLTLEQMNIRPESSHHERGPGQNEVDFHRAEPVTAADHYACCAVCPKSPCS